MPKKFLPFPIVFWVFLLIFSIITAMFSFVAKKTYHDSSHTQNSPEHREFTVILDAGHGGEDGGAVSLSGLFEKDLNLTITKKLQALFEANGIKVVMTRETDVLLYDRTVNYHGRKKALDLAARRKIGESTQNGIFISVHMNSYPLSQYKGLQVWYSANTPQSAILANQIQKTVSQNLQPDNKRKTKAATSSIYLLHHLKIPAVLIECGFLSNAEDTVNLSKSDYQNQLCLAIFLAVMEAQTAQNEK